jgi:hypothetical protein
VLLSVYSYQEEVTPDELIKILASVDRTVAALEKRSGQNYTAVKGGGATAKRKKSAAAASAGKWFGLDGALWTACPVRDMVGVGSLRGTALLRGA